MRIFLLSLLLISPVYLFSLESVSANEPNNQFKTSEEYSITFASFKNFKMAERSYDKLQQLLKDSIENSNLNIQKTKNYNIIKLEHIQTSRLKNMIVQNTKKYFPDLIVRRVKSKKLLSKKNTTTQAPVSKQTSNYTLERAISLYNAKKYQESYNILSQLEMEGLKSEKFYFYMGRTTFELGMYSESVANYDLLLAKNPMHGRARLEKARAHLLLKEYDEAKKEFNTVLATPIPVNVRKNVEAYLAKIEQSQQKNFISGMVYYGHGVDSNVYNNTFLDTTQYGSLQLQNNTKETKAVFNRFIFALEHSYRFSSIENLAWKSSAMLYHNGYREYTDQDIMLLSLSSGPEYIIQNYKMSLPLTYDKINYGNKEYLRVYGVAPSLEMMLDKVSALKATLRLNDKEYLQITDKDKDAGYIELKLEYNRLLFGDNVLSLKGSASSENKKNGTRVDVSRTRYELGASYLLPLNKTLKSNFASGYARSNYLDSDAILGRRQDSYYYINAGLTQQLSKMFAIGANYMYSQNDSNINTYTYKKHVYMINIMMGF